MFLQPFNSTFNIHMYVCEFLELFIFLSHCYILLILFFLFPFGLCIFLSFVPKFCQKICKSWHIHKIQLPTAESRTDIPLYSAHSLQLKWIGRGRWRVAHVLLRKAVCCCHKATQQCVRIDSFQMEWKKKKKFHIMPHKPHIRLRRLWCRRHTLLHAAEVWSCHSSVNRPSRSNVHYEEACEKSMKKGQIWKRRRQFRSGAASCLSLCWTLTRLWSAARLRAVGRCCWVCAREKVPIFACWYKRVSYVTSTSVPHLTPTLVRARRCHVINSPVRKNLVIFTKACSAGLAIVELRESSLMPKHELSWDGMYDSSVAQ